MRAFFAPIGGFDMFRTISIRNKYSARSTFSLLLKLLSAFRADNHADPIWVYRSITFFFKIEIARPNTPESKHSYHCVI